ncbi:MAG: hypothetical protein RBS77_04450 [Candidatus Moranbacteria bacterium]|jgi:glutaredoxin|nr:hypothetical protein [Candidatus Moranbacteria bacterium]
MQNRKIMWMSLLVVVLLGGVFVYWNNQNSAKNEGSSKKETKTLPGKINKEVEPPVKVNDEAAKEEIVNGGEVDSKELENSIIYYYGAECPHCKDVLAYLEENDIYSKVDFIKKEVWNNRSNGEELRNAALKCGMNPSNIGVPFVFSKGKCYMGGPDVTEFFAKEAGIEK